MASIPGGPAPRSAQALIDGWYRWLLPDHRSLGAVVNRWPARLRPLVWRFGLVRAMTLVLAGRGHPAIVTIRRDPGWRSLLLLSALVHRSPKLVVLHFIDHPLRRQGLGGWMDRVWRGVERRCLRRTMLRAHVLSAWEAETYSERYGIDRSRFRHVPFAWRTPPAGTASAFRPAGERAGVIAAGRVSCDWATLFSAARGQDWQLTVVCPGPDRPEVDALNVKSGARARVLSDVLRPEVESLLEASAVSVIATRETGISQGHVRLRAAVDAGAPIVATATRSLEGYVEDGRTALLVAPGDVEALREAVNRLLGDPAARAEMARMAWERAERWTWNDYLSAISELVGGQPAAGPQAASSAAGPESSRREITFETPSAPIDTPYR